MSALSTYLPAARLAPSTLFGKLLVDFYRVMTPPAQLRTLRGWTISGALVAGFLVSLCWHVEEAQTYFVNGASVGLWGLWLAAFISLPFAFSGWLAMFVSRHVANGRHARSLGAVYGATFHGLAHAAVASVAGVGELAWIAIGVGAVWGYWLPSVRRA